MDDDDTALQVFIFLLFIALWVAIGFAVYYHNNPGSESGQCESMNCYPERDYVPEDY